MSGQDIVRQIEDLPVDNKSRPMEEPTIKACGELVKAVKGENLKLNRLKITYSLQFPQPKRKRRRKRSRQRREVPTANQNRAILQANTKKRRKKRKNQRKLQRKRSEWNEIKARNRN